MPRRSAVSAAREYAHLELELVMFFQVQDSDIIVRKSVIVRRRCTDLSASRVNVLFLELRFAKRTADVIIPNFTQRKCRRREEIGRSRRNAGKLFLVKLKLSVFGWEAVNNVRNSGLPYYYGRNNRPQSGVVDFETKHGVSWY